MVPARIVDVLLTLKADIISPTAPVISAAATSASVIVVTMVTPASDVGGVASYAIDRATASNGPWTTLSSAAVFPYSATGLSSSTQYFFRVRATDSGGNVGNDSAVASATTQSLGPQTINVSNATGLVNAISAANSDPSNSYTILLANGTYQVSDLPCNAPNLTIRSASGNRDLVIVRGDAMSGSASTGNIFRVTRSGFTLQDLTVQFCRWSCVQFSPDVGTINAPTIRNCVLRDSYEHLIKGAIVGSFGSTNGLIENCSFLYTAGIAPAQYTGGIDLHRASGWTIKNNTFRDIASPATSAAQHAVNLWNGSTNNIIEQNTVIDCDRGIGSGLNGNPANNGDTIRNNYIYHSNNGDPFGDVQLSVENSTNCLVYNNTVIANHSFAWAMEYRFTTTGTQFRNNISNKAIQARDGGSATLSNNSTNAQNSWFVDVATGNLDLASAVAGVVDAGETIASVTVDRGGTTRPQGSAYDRGADEFIPVPSTPFASIRTYNSGANFGDIDRAKILATSSQALGSFWGTGEGTLELWIRPLVGNSAGTVATGNGQYTWISGNTIVDRDRYNQLPGWGFSLTDGRATFGVKNSNGQYTARGTSDIRNVTQLTHVAIQRNASSGRIRIWVNGTQEVDVTGPTGSLAYPSGASPLSLCGPNGNESCSFSDPYIVIGAEKHNAGNAYPGFSGIWTDVRFSSVARYNGSTITVPSARFTTDANTVGLYSCQEQSGTTLLDSSSNANHGTLMVGGPNNGPQRSTEAPVYVTGSGDPLDLPLATDQNLSISYLGYFQVPLTYFNGGMSITEDGTQIYANTGNTEALARISVPSIGGTASLQIAGTGISGNLGGNGGKSVTGSLQVGSSLLISRSIDYDANFEQSTWIKRANLSIGSQGTMCGMSGGGPRNLSQGLGRVPTIWQSALGGNTFTLGSRMSIISAAQCGYGFGTFNHENVLQGGGTVTVNKLLNYTSGAAGQNWNNALEPIPANPNYSSYPKNSSGGTDWFSETNAPVGTAIIPEGSRSLLYFTTHGYGPSGGQPSCRVGSSVHNGPYRCQIVAYDLRDLVAVRNGQQTPSQPRPYTYDVTNNRRWGAVPNTDALFGNCVGRISAQPGNACYDPVTRRLYWAPNGWDEGTTSQRLHVWQIGTVA